MGLGKTIGAGNIHNYMIISIFEQIVVGGIECFRGQCGFKRGKIVCGGLVVVSVVGYTVNLSESFIDNSKFVLISATAVCLYSWCGQV